MRKHYEFSQAKPNPYAKRLNRQFLRIIESARKEVRAGKTISLEALGEKVWLSSASQGDGSNAENTPLILSG
jgi:hypothetical protein